MSRAPLMVEESRRQNPIEVLNSSHNGCSLLLRMPREQERQELHTTAFSQSCSRGIPAPQRKKSQIRVASCTLPRATSFFSLLSIDSYCFLATYGTKFHEEKETKGNILSPNSSRSGGAAFHHDPSSLTQVVSFPLGIEVSQRNSAVL